MASQVVRPQFRQHTVSRVVLIQFARSRRISVYDHERKAIYCKGPKAVFQQQFDRFDPETSERRWQTVEARMPAIYELIDAHQALDDQAAVDTLRDLLAIHWVRTPAMRQVHERITRDVATQSMVDLRHRPDVPARLLEQRTGLSAAGQPELEWINERVHREILVDRYEELFSNRLKSIYNRARAILAPLHLQIGYAKGLDLMIGDAPVATVKPDFPGVGPHQGVALGEATLICMPISPDVIIALGSQPAEITLNRDQILEFNQLQISGFVRWIGCAPGGESDTALRRIQGVQIL